jgi:cell division septal protein FtsQ
MGKNNQIKKNNCSQWFYLCCGFLVVILGLFAMTLKYNLTMSANQVKLENQNQELKKEIQEVERVNGKEKRDIANLQQEVKELKEKLKGGQHD